MSLLSFKTKEGGLVRGLPRVYFCCHPKDFDAFFEDISNEILSRQNCSVWYHGEESFRYSDEFFEDLLQMNLFVVPVTERFLQQGNPALEKEFRFAVEKNIPILPLMQEKGLDQRFNELCGDIQYLDKNNTDSTCIEYTEKLDAFLSSVLVGDELAKKIRQAFDAYVFLSYRKKDRRYAQQLMRLIHQNEFCRDIAIWYDEFLVPGENFNDAISDALKKSDLFVLTVTPNLVNETNYIMNVEFPMAKEQKKPILPCEMVETDKVLLSQKYEDIPECTDGRDVLMLAESLREHFLNIATRENDNHPEHMFFIGLAYLNGIDVEVDRNRALKLITAAAEKDLPMAISKLIDMYTSGDGVRADGNKALNYRKRLLSVTKNIYEQRKDFSSAFDYVRACFELATAYYNTDTYKEALETATELKKLCKTIATDIDCNGFATMQLNRHTALADLLMGQSYHETNDFKTAKEHYDMAMSIFLRLNEKYDDPMISRGLSLLYVKMAQLCKVAADYKGAIRYYEKALKLQQSNAKKDGLEEHLLDQASTLVRMSEILRILWDINSSKQCCMDAVGIIDKLISVGGAGKYASEKMSVLIHLIETYRIEGNCAAALKVYEELNKLQQIYIKQYGQEHMYVKAKSLTQITHINFLMADYDAVINYGMQALSFVEKAQMLSDRYIAEGGSEGAMLYLFIGGAYYNGRGDITNGIKYMKRAVSIAEKYTVREIVCNIPDLIMIYSFYGDVVQMTGEVAEATKYLEKAARLYEEYLSDNENMRNMCTAFIIYVALGRNRMAKEQLAAAINMLNKAQMLYKKITSLYPSSTKAMERDYGKLCYLMAICYMDCNNDAQAQKYFLTYVEIYEKVPKNICGVLEYSTLGVVYYYLYCLAYSNSEQRKWEDCVFDAAYDIKRLYPTQYKQTNFYEMLKDSGAFD